VPSLVLALWLAPQLLLAGHGHWVSDGTAPDCDICLQLAVSTPAVDTTTASPVQIAAALVVEPQAISLIARRTAGVACRGPPVFPHHASDLQTSV